MLCNYTNLKDTAGQSASCNGDGVVCGVNGVVALLALVVVVVLKDLLKLVVEHLHENTSNLGCNYDVAMLVV